VGDGHECIAFSTEDSCSQPGSNNHSQTIPRKTAVSISAQEEFNQKDMKICGNNGRVRQFSFLLFLHFFLALKLFCF
jgi:hypothetical protein